MYSFIALVQQACIHTCTLCHNDVMGTNVFFLASVLVPFAGCNACN